MSTPNSISSRVFNTFFLGSTVNVFVILAVVWSGYADLEETWLEQDLKEEMRLLHEHSEIKHPGSWKTSELTALWIPAKAPRDELPPLFQAVKVPYTGPLTFDGRSYQVLSDFHEDGTYFLAKDVTNFERRELIFKVLLVVLACSMLMVNYFLSQFMVERLVKPLRTLTSQIRFATVNQSFRPISKGYKEVELNEIASAINRFTAEIDNLVQRERRLLTLASHELRTPITIISGAVQVLERRDHLQNDDKKTLRRIRRASVEMQENVEALFKLSRREQDNPLITLDVRETVSELADELSTSSPDLSERLDIVMPLDAVNVTADRALLKILVRNVLQNALQHTGGPVKLVLTPTCLDVVDQGVGLPESATKRLQKPAVLGIELSGLGLYIVSIVCERFGWKIETVKRADFESTVRIRFQR